MNDTTEVTKNSPDLLSTLAKTKGFLGREFLTWLWYQSENGGDKISLPPAAELGGNLSATLWIDDRIVMQSLDQRGHEHLMRGGAPSHSAEASTALAKGKLVKELKLGLHIDGQGEFTAILAYHDLNPRSLQLPPPLEDGEEQSTTLSLRVYQTKSFLAVLDALFARFLHERTDSDWETSGLGKIRQWMKHRLAKTKPTLH